MERYVTDELLTKLLLHAEYSFTDIDFEWGMLTEKERDILTREDMEEIKNGIEEIHINRLRKELVGLLAPDTFIAQTPFPGTWDITLVPEGRGAPIGVLGEGATYREALEKALWSARHAYGAGAGHG